MSVVIYVVGFFVTWILVAGWVNAKSHYDSKHFYPLTYAGSRELVERREDYGFAIGWSLLGSVIWPLFLPMNFFSSGFAAHGWTLRMMPKKDKQ